MVDRVQIHPLTLEFDDEILEAQLKSDTLNLTVMRAGCILTLMLLSCMESAGYGRLPVQFFGALFICLIAFVICYTPQFVIRFMPKRMQELISSKDKQHTSLTVLGVCVWSVCMLAWWRMIFTGALPRIQPDEFGKVLACCGLWVVATIGVHVLHFPFKCRVVFLFTSMPIVLTSEIAQPLLAALFGGTLLGHVLESVMRSNFRDRMHLVERLSQEKERVLYELNMTRHRQEAQRREDELARQLQAEEERAEEQQALLQQVTQQQQQVTQQQQQKPMSGVPERFERSVPWLPHGDFDDESLSRGTNSEILELSQAVSQVRPEYGPVPTASGTAPDATPDATLRQRRSVRNLGHQEYKPLLSRDRSEALWRTLGNAGVQIDDDQTSYSGASVSIT